MGVVDLALPDQGMPLLVAGPQILLRSVSGMALFELFECHLVRKAALDDVEEDRSTFLRRALELRFVRELQPDASALYPADGTFDSGTFAKAQLDHVPKSRTEIAADHGSAAREVHNLDVARLAVVER